MFKRNYWVAFYKKDTLYDNVKDDAISGRAKM